MPAGPMQAGIRVTNLLVLGMLPARVRRLFDLSWSPVHEGAFQTTARAVRASRRVVPGSVRRGGNRALFDLVAATEKRRVGAGQPTIDVATV